MLDNPAIQEKVRISGQSVEITGKCENSANDMKAEISQQE
jgi:hypothetical protein